MRLSAILPSRAHCHLRRGVVSTLRQLWRSIRTNKCCRAILVLLVTLLVLVTSAVTYALVEINCSSEVVNIQLQELCDLYTRGDIAGNMCHKLCHQGKFFTDRCAGYSFGKTVNILRCQDCQSEHVVLKNLWTIDIWTREHGLVFENAHEDTRVVVNKTSEFLRKRFRTRYLTDLSHSSDVFSFIWRQNMSEFVEKGIMICDSDCKKRRILAALQSIRALSLQHEYASIILNTAPYMPALLGTCGPAYIVEYTPSLILAGYVLYQGKPDEVLLLRWSKVVPWRDRARVALELIHALRHLESLNPPQFMGDLAAHNFGVDSGGHLRILDAETVRNGRVAMDETVCHSDSDCRVNKLKRLCNFTSNTCGIYPVNNMIQVACRSILRSYIPAFGLLRDPPAAIADRLQQVLTECIFPPPTSGTPRKEAWKSNDTVRYKLVSLLHESLTI